MKATQATTIFLASIAAALVATADGEVITIHGSGTTNPSKCIWHIMSLFEERSQISTRLTYRAVGSTTGQVEFLGKDNTGEELTGGATITSHVPHNYFGSGDIPISKEEYDALNLAVEAQDGSDDNNGGKHMVHLPFAMSSVSFFHSIPGVPDGKDGIKLDACDLAKIYNGKVNKWNADADILSKQNDEVKEILMNLTDDIFVARRVEGSSSTSSITQFLRAKCPEEWSAEWVSSKLGDKWHPSTVGCQGSGGMTDCVNDNAGAIGYLDSGHGWSEELAEINVKNEDGVFLTSKNSQALGGISDAARAGNIPDSADGDWSAVNFLNKSGENTWPIVLMSYVYVRKDVNRFIATAEERGLLKLFLESLYDNAVTGVEYFSACEELGFAPPPPTVKTIAMAGIESISWDLEYNVNMWTHEIDTLPITGMGKYVISAKRRSLAGVSIENIAGAETKLKGDVVANTATVAELMKGPDGTYASYFLEDGDRRKIEAALVLSALSFTIWSVVAIGFVVKTYICFK